MCLRKMSNSSERSQRRSSRFAEPMHTPTAERAGIVTPSSSVSSVVNRCTVVSGVSKRNPSSMAGRSAHGRPAARRTGPDV